jgi:hypothetical protein
VSLVVPLIAAVPAIIIGILGLQEVRASRGRVEGAGMAIAGLVLGIVSTLCWAGGMLLVYPAVSRVSEAAARAHSANNLKQIALALHNYHDTYGRLPPAAIYSRAGKPLLSWRVAILPFIEQQSLFQQFKLDEPWDSPNNKPLLAIQVLTYQFPRDIDLPPDHTIYRVFEGPGAAFDGPRGRSFGEFADGTANTLLVIEADQGVPWTKPDELAFDPRQPVAPIKGHFANGFQAAMADGAVRLINRNTSETTLRAAITRNGGEILRPDW